MRLFSLSLSVSIFHGVEWNVTTRSLAPLDDDDEDDDPRRIRPRRSARFSPGPLALARPRFSEKQVYSLVFDGEHDCGSHRRCPPSPLVSRSLVRFDPAAGIRDVNGTGAASRAYYLIEITSAVGARPVHSAAT